MTKIFIFESKSWALVVFHEICSEATQRIETRKNNSLFNQCFNQFKEQKPMEKTESLFYKRDESIMKKSRYSLALHPES
jgi:hypothetical protein|tara:strand:- start:332 stop:568 length:237 start_codon:yes stop_codon:yes gene_type:complete